MNKELARDILDLLDSPKHVETISEYAEREIQRLYTTLEGCDSELQMARAQGGIAALKQLKKLRETAAQIVENSLGKTSNSTTRQG